MPLYDIRCEQHGVTEIFRHISESGPFLCPQCSAECPQIYHAPFFVEDRVRFFKGPLGNGYSFALGEQMPQTRKERDRLAAAKGVEFIGLREHLAENKEAAEAVAYTAHVQSGGDRCFDTRPPSEPAPWVSKPAWAPV